jgi:hypothetical protein
MLEMILEKILSNRLWDLKLSFCKRYCYISGESLRYKICYRGRKKIYSLVSGPKGFDDDIWLSQKEYLSRLSKNHI